MQALEHSGRVARRRHRLVFTLLLSIPGLAAAVGSDPTLRVEVGNVAIDRAGSGSVFVSVYDQDGFLSRPLLVRQLESAAGTVEAEFSLAPGTYCVSAYQDTDGNGRLNRNFIGIPKEPVGFSNGYVPRFGPPKFSGCRFAHDGEGTVRLRLARP